MDRISASALPLSKEEVRARIRASEANIQRLTSEMGELDRARQKERRALGQLWFMLAPVGKLPTELLVEIFALAAVESDSGDDSDDGVLVELDPTQQILLISEVCSVWRQIVISSPRLWATGYVSVHLSRARHSLDNFVEGLTMQLERSAPLSIAVILSCGEADTENGTAILMAMLPTASRWNYLNADSSAFEELDQMDIDIPLGTFTALKTLELAAFPSAPTYLFSVCPQLRSLRLITETTSARDNMLQIPWAQLTHLDLEEPNLANCCFILQHCTSLLSAKLTAKRWDGTENVVATILPFLRTLVLEYPPHIAEEVEPLFMALRLPSLRVLELTFNSEVIWSAQAFSAFQAHAPNLTQFTLTVCPITSQELVELFRLAPMLTTLSMTICHYCIDRDFLDAFRYDGTPTHRLVPQLQFIDWRWIGSNLDSDAFEAAIRSRCWIGDAAPSDVARLQTVKVMPVQQPACAILLERMQDLVDHGLELFLG
ncbi:hypothetical protein DFH06DRAFT_1464884 [Mycena polygramma]|nr:hypothetical protein DFH06DRAFT_1464884 [Mycena polygramma]